MKTILVPTDFSPAATNAMHYAIEMAKSINASLHLLHIYQVPVSFTDVPVVLVSVEELQKNAEQQMNELKRDVGHITSGALQVTAETRLGNVMDEIADVAAATRPFLVVMGTTGTSDVERVFFGSNTLAAIRHLDWPVICVPPGKRFGNGIQKAGFACDFRDVVATTPAGKIKEIIRAFHAELHVLNVDYDNRHFKPETPEESLLLHTLLEEVNPQYHFIEHRDIEDGINEFAEKNNLDLIIAIPKKHKLLDGIFKPSSTKQLVYQSHVPVMCLHE